MVWGVNGGEDEERGRRRRRARERGRAAVAEGERAGRAGRARASRAAFWPPKTKSLSEGTDSIAMAAWFHTVVGSSGHQTGFSSSGL